MGKKSLAFNQIIVPLVSAIIVGLFSYWAGIGAVKLSNENNLKISRENNEAMLATIEKSNAANLEIAKKNNMALLESVNLANLSNKEISKNNMNALIESVEISNKSNQKISEKNYIYAIEQLKKQYELNDELKNKEIEKENKIKKNQIIADVSSILRTLNLVEIHLKSNKKYYDNLELDTLIDLYIVIITRDSDKIIDKIHKELRPIDFKEISSAVNGLDYNLTYKIINLYNELDILYKNTNTQYSEKKYNYEKFNDHPLTDFWTSNIIKLYHARNELREIDSKFFNISLNVGTSKLLCLLILKDLTKELGVSDDFYDDKIKEIKDISENNYENYSIMSKSLEDKIELLSDKYIKNKKFYDIF